ncbi:MAG: hypothetical protein ROO76_19010 [Terriglobia bacterium]|nr:hypothetical protein [Terriglobia bacterium]
MTIPKRESEFESGPPRRPATPGEPEERTDTGAVRAGDKAWKSRFPGWETYDGCPREARVEHGEDPTHDFRYDTNLNPSSVVPRHLGPVVYVLGAVLGFLLLVFVGLLMFYHFMAPGPRSPEGTKRLIPSVSTNVAAVRIAGKVMF